MKRILSFSLWGNNPLYTVGAIANADLAKKFYPGWICRFYIHRGSIPQGILSQLSKRSNVELVDMPDDIGWSGMLWRFYPATEPDVEVMLSRDCDSRLNAREKACVDRWLNVNDGAGRFRKVMTIRDTCVHQSQMMGGLWGVRDGFLKFIKPHLDELIERTRNSAIKGMDQDFLNNNVYLYSLGLLDSSFNPIRIGSTPDSEFMAFDDIAFGARRFGNTDRRPHDRELILPTQIQREFGDEYLACVHCGLNHDNSYIGKVESLSDEESHYLDLTSSEQEERRNIIKYYKKYLIYQVKYGLSPVQHEHGSEKIN
jgi:hypothetical protein